MKRPDEVTEYLRCGGANCDGACNTQLDKLGVEDCLTWRVHGYVQKLEERIVHLEALDQQNLSVITMQERTRARLEEQISQIESNVHRWISVEERLPERHGQMCVCLYNQHGADKSILFPYVFTWHAYGDNGYVNGPHFSDEGLDGLKVWYWMPLPEPPKEDEGC